MILTGKCKKDFLIKIYYEEDTNQASDESNKELLIFHSNKWLERQDDRLIQSLIIDFFDSVGIIIEISLDQTTYPKYHYEVFKYEHFGNYNALYNDGLYTNRQQVTTEVIKKANELYNNDK